MQHTTLATARLQFLLLLPRSGGMLAVWVSAMQTIMKKKACLIG
jgi:hypothetical protein